MANYCDSTYRITGDASELDTLYALMLKLEKEKENGNRVGHIVKELNGSIPEHLYVRGWWMTSTARATASASIKSPLGSLFTRLGISSARSSRRFKPTSSQKSRDARSTSNATTPNTDGSPTTIMWMPCHRKAIISTNTLRPLTRLSATSRRFPIPTSSPQMMSKPSISLGARMASPTSISTNIRRSERNKPLSNHTDRPGVCLILSLLPLIC